MLRLFFLQLAFEGEAPVAETAPTVSEEAAPAAEPGGLDDIFAKLANLSEELERPAPPPAAPAPPPRPAAHVPAGPPARRGEVRPPAAQVVTPRPAVSPTLPTRPGAPKAAAALAAAASAPAVKKRLLRCPKCQVIFEVQDTGVRPLPIKCTACGTTGSLKK